MVDVSVIILTQNERLHIRRCLDRLVPLEPRQIFIIDCFSNDETKSIVDSFAANIATSGQRLTTNGCRLTTNHYPLPTIHFVEHEWPGNQAAQFQWALDNLPIESKWILRLDADEYLTNELIAEIKEKLPRIDDGIDGIVLKRRHVVGWLGNRWIKRGMYPTRILRLFRKGHGRSDLKIMDEHIVVEGSVVPFDNDFVDHSLISLPDWQVKHRGYAKREAKSYLSGERSTGEKAAKKDVYYKLPPYFRAVAYFCIRYFLKLGFLDGRAGWRWHFWQGLWYRWIVDREIGRMKRGCSR